MIARLALSTALLGTLFALSAGEAQDRLRSLLELRLDSEQCYRVRDLFLEREDIKLYLTDGLLIFAEPHEGRDVAALFLAERPEDVGEIVVIPPDGRERQSAMQYTGQTVINERFRSALMLFSDDTAQELRRGLGPAAQADSAAGERLSQRWSPVLRNILEGVSLRLLVDLISDLPPEDGLFAAAVGGGRLGRFDVVYDPRQEAQISLGQTVSRSGATFYETWAQFEARSYRQGRRESTGFPAALADYRIETEIFDDLSMKVVARAQLTPSSGGYRAFALALSSSLRPESVKLGDAEAEVLQVGRAGAGRPSRDEDTIMFVLPEAPPMGVPLELEMRYSGELIARAGDDVFFVRNRANWYPTADRSFSDFLLTFRYPAALELVATGKRVSETETDGVRTSVFQTETPARLAGFNLGRYVSARREVGDYAVEVRANRNVEERLRPRAQSTVVMPQAPVTQRRRRFESPPVVVTTQPPPPPNPAANIEVVADFSRDAFEYFLDKYGPPPTSSVFISPIPAGFGQGFPGLVYASTLSYLREDDPPLKSMAPTERVFYSQLLLPHEISHQWWGNVVAVDSLSDNWILEALATYSSLLLLEEREGPQARDRILATFKTRLLQENVDGRPVDSAGPLVLGDRLRSSKFPSAYRIILYEKGAWVIHMLRGRLGDEAFFAMLRAVLDEYKGKYIDVEQFRQAAAHALPDGAPDAEFQDFFDQWVYGTGIPELSIRWKQEGSRLGGELRRAGVPSNTVIRVPVRAILESGEAVEWTIESDDSTVEIDREIKGKVIRIAVDPGRTLLAVVRST